MGDLLVLGKAAEGVLINSVEVGDSSLATAGYKSYIWSYHRKEGGQRGIINGLILIASTKKEADKLFLKTIKKRTRLPSHHLYGGDTWYVRKEAGAFYPDEKDPVLMASYT